jgi:hypothetical protein
MDMTQIRRKQGNISSETESDSDHGKREEETRSQRSRYVPRQAPREEKYHSSAQHDSTKDREQFFQDQLQLMADELKRVRMDNLNLTRVSSQQQAELNAYAEQEFSTQFRAMEGNTRNTYIPRSGGPSGFGGVDPQSTYDTSIHAYDMNDINSCYYLLPCPPKTLAHLGNLWNFISKVASLKSLYSPPISIPLSHGKPISQVY